MTLILLRLLLCLLLRLLLRLHCYSAPSEGGHQSSKGKSSLASIRSLLALDHAGDVLSLLPILLHFLHLLMLHMLRHLLMLIINCAPLLMTPLMRMLQISDADTADMSYIAGLGWKHGHTVVLNSVNATAHTPGYG